MESCKLPDMGFELFFPSSRFFFGVSLSLIHTQMQIVYKPGLQAASISLLLIGPCWPRFLDIDSRMVEVTSKKNMPQTAHFHIVDKEAQQDGCNMNPGGSWNVCILLLYIYL